MTARATQHRAFHGALLQDGGLIGFDSAGRATAAACHGGVQVMFVGRPIALTAAPSASAGQSSPGDPAAGLLAAAFRSWQRALQAHVAGEYAAAIYDPLARVGLVTHDALGLTPVFYATAPGALVFSTDLLRLVEPHAGGGLDREYIADLLAVGFITGRRTPYPDVNRLLPGETLWWSEAGVRTLRTWDLADCPAVTCATPGLYDEQFRSLLQDGIRGACDPAGRTWVALSGGLDSSTIAAVAARQGGSGLAAYSIIDSGAPEADERQWMEAVVSQYGLPWFRQDIRDMLPFTDLPTLFHGEPTAAVIYERQRAVQDGLFAAEGMTVLLDGFGGDDVLGRSPGPLPGHLSDRLFDFDPLGALRDLARWRAGVRQQRSLTHWLLKGLAEPAVSHLLHRSSGAGRERLPYPGWVRPDYARQMQLKRRAARSFAPHCRHPGRQRLWTALWLQSFEIGTRRPSQHYARRHPLTYRPLVEFMCGVPWDQKLRPRCDRFMQRRALQGILPEPIRRRASKGSGTPTLLEGLRLSRHWVEFLCDSPQMPEFGIVERDVWRDAVRKARVGQTDGDKFFLAGVTLEAWLQQHKAWRQDASGRRWRPPGGTATAPVVQTGSLGCNDGVDVAAAGRGGPREMR